MSILFKSFFMNQWGIPSVRKTWLQVDKPYDAWQNKDSTESGFLTPNNNNATFLDENKTQDSWLQNEDGTSDFQEEGNEKYI